MSTRTYHPFLLVYLLTPIPSLLHSTINFILCVIFLCLWGERVLAVSIAFLCRVSQYCFPLLGTTPQESSDNFLVWVTQIVKRGSKTVKVSEDEDGELQGCYEQMSCSDLQKVTAIFAKLSAWREECIRNNCSAGELLTITGNESKMTITRQRLV